MDVEAAWGVFLHKAGDEIVAFMTDHGGRPDRKTRRRRTVSDEQLAEAARTMLRHLHAEPDTRGRDLNIVPTPEAATPEQIRDVIAEATAQGLEEWWQKVGSHSLTKPHKRRQIWWWIQERLGGRELLPLP